MKIVRDVLIVLLLVAVICLWARDRDRRRDVERIDKNFQTLAESVITLQKNELKRMREERSSNNGSVNFVR